MALADSRGMWARGPACRPRHVCTHRQASDLSVVRSWPRTRPHAAGNSSTARCAARAPRPPVSGAPAFARPSVAAVFGGHWDGGSRLALPPVAAVLPVPLVCWGRGCAPPCRLPWCVRGRAPPPTGRAPPLCLDPPLVMVAGTADRLWRCPPCLPH